MGNKSTTVGLFSSKLRAFWHLEFFGFHRGILLAHFRLVQNVLAATVTISVIIKWIYPDIMYKLLLQ